MAEQFSPGKLHLVRAPMGRAIGPPHWTHSLTARGPPWVFDDRPSCWITRQEDLPAAGQEGRSALYGE
jgi:hypothetical protein